MWTQKLLGYGAIGVLLVCAGCGTGQCGPVFPDDAGGSDDSMVIEPQDPSAQPGKSMVFSVARWSCCEPALRASSTPCVIWSIDPPEAGSISSNGVLDLAEDVEEGQQVTVKASFPTASPLLLSTVVTVYRAETNILVGVWRGKRALSCVAPKDSIDDAAFDELEFKANGEFSVTWDRSSRTADLRGTYEYDHQTGALTMEITDGNDIPEDADLDGVVETREDGSLRLLEVSFGPTNEVARQVCGYELD